jgi:hypothetical protein
MLKLNALRSIKLKKIINFIKECLKIFLIPFCGDVHNPDGYLGYNTITKSEAKVK